MKGRPKCCFCESCTFWRGATSMSLSLVAPLINVCLDLQSMLLALPSSAYCGCHTALLRTCDRDWRPGSIRSDARGPHLNEDASTHPEAVISRRLCARRRVQLKGQHRRTVDNPKLFCDLPLKVRFVPKARCVHACAYALRLCLCGCAAKLAHAGTLTHNDRTDMAL